MKYGLLICWVLFLSACSGFNQPKPTVGVIPIPGQWSGHGRISIQQADVVKNYGFELKVRPDLIELELGDSLGLSKMVLRQTRQQLWVNNKLVSQDLPTWLQSQLGWRLSIKSLERIVFNHQMTQIGDWQVIVSKTQTIHNRLMPKIVRLSHRYNGVKIKLLFGDINS